MAKRAMTPTQIIDETIAYYSENPKARRSVTISPLKKRKMCLYHQPDGRMCAVGRCLIDPQAFHMNNDTVSQICGDDNNQLDSMLKEQYRGHSMHFWQDLQNLHDGDEYWNEKGLTNEGQEYANCLKADWEKFYTELEKEKATYETTGNTENQPDRSF